MMGRKDKHNDAEDQTPVVDEVIEVDESDPEPLSELAGASGDVDADGALDEAEDAADAAEDQTPVSAEQLDPLAALRRDELLAANEAAAARSDAFDRDAHQAADSVPRVKHELGERALDPRLVTESVDDGGVVRNPPSFEPPFNIS